MKTLATLVLGSAMAFAQPVPVIFDTDMGNDIDDALALAMLHSLESRGEIKLLAVTLSKDNVWAPRYVSAINTFYGRASLPVGKCVNGKTTEDGKYNRQSLEGKQFRYSDTNVEAVELLRKTLNSAADASVVVIQVGFSTNLARLLESDRALIAKKVKLLSMMAGDFSANARPEYNVKIDIPAAKALAAQWPTPVVWSGFEIGRAIKYPAKSILNDFKWTPSHPVVEGYKHYMKMPYDRETWDLTSVLYAVRPDAGYFDLSETGAVSVDDQGNTAFRPAAGGNHRYLKLSAAQHGRILEAMTWLASQPAFATSATR